MKPTTRSSSIHRRSALGPPVGLGLAVILTLLSGVLHGRLTQRWGDATVFEQPAQRLEGLPEQFGDWQLQEVLSLSDSAIDLLQCQGYVHRVYRHQGTGQRVQVAVMVGPGSKMSIHVPEICFEAANYTLVSSRERVELREDGHTDAFWSVQFRLNDASQQPLSVLYGWSKGGEWLAPRMPRWSVAGTRVLYKLQLSTIGVAGEMSVDGSETETAGRAFLTDFLPLLRRQLAGGSSPSVAMVDAVARTPRWSARSPHHLALAATQDLGRTARLLDSQKHPVAHLFPESLEAASHPPHP